MTNLTTVSNPIDDLLSGFFVRPVGLEPRNAERPLQFRMDVWETENAYRVVADLPGVRKEDINVTIEGADVGISAEAKREQTVGENEKQLLAERGAGKFYRSFTLGHEIDDTNAQARYADGVL